MNLGKYEQPVRLVLIGIALSLLYLAILTPAGFLEGLRLRSHDTYFRWRNAAFRAPAEFEQIVLVTIDEESQRHLGKRWPWNRSLLAEFLNQVSPQQPQMVLFDLVLFGASESAHDSALAEAIQRAPPVLLACYLDQHGDPVFPLSLFTEAGGIVGLINKPRDVDLRVRRLFAGIRVPLHREPLYAMEVGAAALAKRIPLEALRLDLEYLTLGPIRVPLEIPNTMAINYWVDLGNIQQISFWRVLEDPLALPLLRNKIVLVGSASEITHDVYPTPIGLMPGALIGANGIVTLLSARFLQPVPMPLALLLGTLLVVSILLLTYRLSPAAGGAATLGLTALGVLGGFLGLAWLDYRTEYLSILLLAGAGWLSGILYRYLLLLTATVRLHRRILTDPVSGACTNRYFRLRLEAVYSATPLNRRPLSLAVLQMEPPSELLHHSDWSEVQRRIHRLAGILQWAIPRAGFLGRLTEDRFAALLPRMPLPQATAWAQRVQQELASVPGRIGLGLACTGQGGVQVPAALILCAEAAAARARAKAMDGCTLEVFDPKQDKLILEQTESAAKMEPSDRLGYVAGELEERKQALEKALDDLRKAHKEMEGNFLEVTKALVMALETKDEYTAGHLERVSRYSTRLAEVLGLPQEQIQAIREAALLHDIGKLGLPDEVLHKVGPLTEEEKGILKQHLSMGARILEPMKFFKPITTLIYHHHERYDGKGYPHGLTGEFIPSGAQMIAIADAFDAMTTHRGYNDPLTVQGALEELRKGSGTQFNPVYVEAYIQLIEKEGVQRTGDHAV